jgi:CRP-like cAMP-binding protein
VTAIPSTSVAEFAAQLPVFRNALIKAQASSDLEMRQTLSCMANHSMHQRFARWLSQLVDHHG